MLAHHAPTSRSTHVPVHNLDSLARLAFDELDALYRVAVAPTTMRVADGALRGRMLAIRGVRGAVAGWLRGWAGSSSFVWDGKTFRADSDSHGMGHNRVNVPNVLGRQSLFPFATSFGASAIDGKPALVLDYDLEVNPPYIRRIHDEVREVAPRLLLGPAMWKGARAKTLVLWFALDARTA